MRHVILVCLFVITSIISFSQSTYKLKADSVRITNDATNAELILENSTKNVDGGFLYNKGNGRTEFRKAMVKLNDSTYLFGTDTLKLSSGGSGITLAPIGNSPNANAASISGSTLTLQPADSAFGGIVTTGLQKFAGDKIFKGTVLVNASSSVGGAYALEVNGNAYYAGTIRANYYGMPDANGSTTGMGSSANMVLDFYTGGASRMKILDDGRLRLGVYGFGYQTGTVAYNLAVDASGNVIETPVTSGGGGSGTVTSISMTTPSWLTVNGSPITTSGTLAVTSTTGQTANQFLATPNGSTGAVGLRSIVAADIPNLDAGKVTTGTMATARLGSGTADSSTYLGGDQAYHSAIMSKGVSVTSPTTSENIMIFFTPVPITITNVQESIVGSSTPSVTYVLGYASTRSGSLVNIVNSHTANAGGASASLTPNVNVPGGSYIILTTSLTNGTINDFNVTINYRQ